MFAPFDSESLELRLILSDLPTVLSVKLTAISSLLSSPLLRVLKMLNFLCFFSELTLDLLLLATVDSDADISDFFFDSLAFLID